MQKQIRVRLASVLQNSGFSKINPIALQFSNDLICVQLSKLPRHFVFNSAEANLNDIESQIDSFLTNRIAVLLQVRTGPP